MARLVGVDLPREKRIEIALTYIFGVGRTRAQQALAEMRAGINIARLALQREQREIARLGQVASLVERDGCQAADIRRKVEIGSYQGIRHRRGLPVRGQRTKTNARTRKGPKRTVAGKKRAAK